MENRTIWHEIQNSDEKKIENKFPLSNCLYKCKGLGIMEFVLRLR